MALVSVVGVQIRDFTGSVKTTNFYFPATTSLADIQTAVNTIVTDMDAAIDGAIDEAFVTIGLTLPGGIKGTAVEGQRVHDGALLSYSAANTAYRHSVFIPTWENAGFSGNSVLTTGVYDTFEGQVAALTSDKQGNALDSFLEGNYKSRK